jgi:hypothetical protein
MQCVGEQLRQENMRMAKCIKIEYIYMKCFQQYQAVFLPVGVVKKAYI